MNKSHKVAVGIVAAAGLGLAVASVYADPQGMGQARGRTRKVVCSTG